ncbi:uncharacterized protein ACA1_146400 [Acanthamoeba castellanii str. Neff]|uniref:Uncharacterized protein n=1 Tax=Acanthamoeba castellanii (strain ATCC 30010 / Neff) TaxID=1257118 RepID=L8GWN3_ACACF|nr:uncharacterized protein ACA1_146400 [Acanthamoeba castellanii str. Neff]ELR16506.1 hypothetical protein ACA1_146400 [Acanthamoeba castellanii str. Neff]
MEAEEIKTKPHKQLVVCQYSTGNTKEQCKEAARLLALPNLELAKTLEGHAAPKPTTLQNLIKELNCLVPEGQVFISLDNLNSAMEADCCCEDPEELCHIWDWICVVEYIVLCGKNIEIEQPHSITSKVVDMFHKHPFQLKLLSDEAEETTPRQL